MRRGLTLVELMLAGGLLSLLLTVTLSFVFPSMRASSRGALRVDLQERVHLGLENMVLDLERCSASSVWVFPGNPSGMSLQRMDTYTSGGAQVWEPSLITYHWRTSTGRLIRETWAGQPVLSITPRVEQPAAPSAADFLKIANQTGGREKLLADSVTDFTASWANRVLQLTLVMERSVHGRPKKERFEMRRSVFFRNNW